MKPTQILLLSFLLLSLAVSFSIQESLNTAIKATAGKVEESQPTLRRSNALKEIQITQLMTALDETTSDRIQEEKSQQPNQVQQTDSQDAIAAQLGFFDGLIIGLQVHADGESACLVAYRYHRDVVNTAFSNLFQFNRSLFFQALLNLVNLTSNVNSLIEDCQVNNFIYFTANTLTIPGFASLVTRLARNTVLITDVLSTVDFNQPYSIGLLIGTFTSVFVGFSLP